MVDRGRLLTYGKRRGLMLPPDMRPLFFSGGQKGNPMDNNNNMHSRRLVTVNIKQELQKEDTVVKPEYEPLVIPLEELAKCLGIQRQNLGRYLPKNN